MSTTDTKGAPPPYVPSAPPAGELPSTSSLSQIR